MRKHLAPVWFIFWLAVAGPALAAPVSVTATVSIDNPSPAYGDTIILTAVVDADGATTQMRTVCVHDFGSSYGHSSITEAGTYTDNVGLYAPNWPSGGATCTATVLTLVFNQHGRLIRSNAIGSLTFTVSP